MEDGVRKGLYRGLSINYLRVVPQVAVMFSVYELTKQFLSQELTSPRSEWVVYAPSDSVKTKQWRLQFNQYSKRLRTIDQNLEIGFFIFFLTWHGKSCRSVFQKRTKQHLMTCFSAGSCSKCWGVNRIVGISYYITKRTHCYCLIKLGVAFV